MKFLFLLALLFLVVPPSFGQDKATVYVYNPPHKKMLTRVAPGIYCNDQKLAEIPGGRYFLVKLDTGTYSFRSKSKTKGGVEVDLKSGEIYYLRVRLDADGYFLRFDSLELVPPESGRFAIKQLKPIEKKDIKSPMVEAVLPPKT